MRLALIVGARPIFCKGKPFPRVPLEAGGWRIDIEGLVDSKLRLVIETRISRENGTYEVPSVVEIGKDSAVQLLKGPCRISIEVVEAGREQNINVYAVAINGPNTD